MPPKRFQCRECSASFDHAEDAEAHEDARDHFVPEMPPQGASDRERMARGFKPNPQPTEGHLSVVDGKRVGRRRADY